MNNGSRIARNTMFLYFRMMCVMLVSLYTVRVTLTALGVEDYGIYQAVGGIVTMLSFINNALGTGSSRFLTFELGKGFSERLKQTFSTLLMAHVFIAVCVLVVAELAGMWYIFTHLNVADEKIFSAVIVFQLSVITAMMSMTQIPYTATIIAHEQLKIYAYVSLVEVSVKLAIAFAISVSPYYRLELYAFMLCCNQLLVMMIYRVYCYRHYMESHFSRKLISFDLLRPVVAFSSWSCFASLAISLINQGTLLLLNTFFSPAVVSARVIALQVNSAAQQFLDNFRTAANPQIIKKFASGDYAGSQKLLLASTRLSYFLMLVLAIPIIILAEPLLNFWLTDVPEYAVAFLQWSMVQSLFAVFDSSLYIALYAKGQLRENALLSPSIGFLVVPLEYILFRYGYSPMVVAYLLTGVYATLGLIIKPVLICRIANYRYADIFRMFVRCGIVTLLSLGSVYLLITGIDVNTYQGFGEICVITLISNLVIISCFGLKKDEREMIMKAVRKKFAKLL